MCDAVERGIAVYLSQTPGRESYGVEVYVRPAEAVNGAIVPQRVVVHIYQRRSGSAWPYVKHAYPFVEVEEMELADWARVGIEMLKELDEATELLD